MRDWIILLVIGVVSLFLVVLSRFAQRRRPEPEQSEEDIEQAEEDAERAEEDRAIAEQTAIQEYPELLLWQVWRHIDTVIIAGLDDPAEVAEPYVRMLTLSSSSRGGVFGVVEMKVSTFRSLEYQKLEGFTAWEIRQRVRFRQTLGWLRTCGFWWNG